MKTKILVLAAAAACAAGAAVVASRDVASLGAPVVDVELRPSGTCTRTSACRTIVRLTATSTEVQRVSDAGFVVPSGIRCTAPIASAMATAVAARAIRAMNVTMMLCAVATETPVLMTGASVEHKPGRQDQTGPRASYMS
jgi:hypothetical protein